MDAPANIDEYIHLIGRPPQAEFLRFLRSKSVDFMLDQGSIFGEQWRSAAELVQEQQTTEKGIADGVELLSLPEEMLPIAEQALQAPGARRAAQHAPRKWHLVELDRLVVYQKTVNLQFVAEIRRTLSSPPTTEQIANLAMGAERALPNVRHIQGQDRAFYFSSSSNDLQFLDVVAVDPATITGYEPSGYARAAVVVYVGYGVNFINAFRANGRLILSNGSHRAYALREAGVTHVPCFVGDATREEHFELLAPVEVRQARAEYLTSARPPMLKDYFDPALRAIVRTTRRSQLLQLQCTFNRIDTPAN